MDREEILKRLHELSDKGVLVPRDDMIKTEEQILGIKKAGEVNTQVLDEVSRLIRPYMSTLEIDNIVERKTKELGGICACLGYEGFPKNCCTSINDQVCHGIPSKNDIIRPGDIINVDCTTIVDGYYGDSSRMFIVGGHTDPKVERLVRVAKECLDKAFEAIVPWETTLGDIGYIINKHAVSNGFSVVLEVGGHGVGVDFHEDPYVCHVGKKGKGILLVPGMTFTIEPMINMGKRHVFIDASNDWTIYTVDRKPSAQWEYTIAILEDGAHIYAK